MQANNPLYKRQGIHVICSIFTVEKGITKILLIKRKNEPYKNMWALVGGALYNNEDLIDGLKREIFEKTGIKDIDIYLSGVFGKKDRAKDMRMVAISYIGVIDNERVKILNETLKTVSAVWYPLDLIPKLAYDHNEVLDEAIKTLKKIIMETNILKSLYPNGFVLPEIQKTYESILNIKLDRRNFRKKILTMVEDTNKQKVFDGTKPAKVYIFKDV